MFHIFIILCCPVRGCGVLLGGLRGGGTVLVRRMRGWIGGRLVSSCSTWTARIMGWSGERDASCPISSSIPALPKATGLYGCCLHLVSIKLSANVSKVKTRIWEVFQRGRSSTYPVVCKVWPIQWKQWFQAQFFLQSMFIKVVQ